MDEKSSKALLPGGLRDTLPPQAAFEASVSQRLMSMFAENGYEQVNPPLVEFEDAFFSGAGAAMTRDTFRLMDPSSQRMMVLRSDMTVQVARIATSRLAGVPRPLRLAYVGQVLRLKSSQTRPQRQFRQAGFELIGSESASADMEVIVLSAESLRQLGVPSLTIDLNLPTLVPAVCAELGFEGEDLARLKGALDRKDATTVSLIAGTGSRILLDLLKASGPAEGAPERLAKLDLPPAAVEAVEHLGSVISLVRREAPELNMTVDAVEHRGFEYHTGTSFAVFARGVRGELGRGGRYLAGSRPGGPAGEAAVGVTLYMDMVQAALPKPQPTPRIFMPVETPYAERRRWHEQGWATICGLEAVTDERQEALRLRCTHRLVDGTAEALGD